MKKVSKKFLAVVLVGVMMFCLTACGGGMDMSKVKGDWTLSSIDGKSPADKAVELGLPSYALLNNYSIGDKVTISTYDPNSGEVKVSTELSIEATSNGFTATDSNGGKVSFIYDSDKNTLSYSATGANGNAETYVLTKGATDILAAVQAESGASEGASEGGEESYEGGDEEYYEE